MQPGELRWWADDVAPGLGGRPLIVLKHLNGLVCQILSEGALMTFTVEWVRINSTLQRGPERVGLTRATRPAIGYDGIMIKPGFTAIPKGATAIAWRDRRCDKNRLRFPRGTVGVVTGLSYVRGYPWPRADIGDVIHTLNPGDWEFTSVRVGELRRWKDDRDEPFVIVMIEGLKNCKCLGPRGVFGTTCGYLEAFTEVIGEAR
jgi:hypothetical protein